ncbi:hypothetical protein CEXT_61231, partial [Caerostris extrusa]
SCTEKDGIWRFLVDYLQLNKITKKDVCFPPRLKVTLECLNDAEFFSSSMNLSNWVTGKPK